MGFLRDRQSVWRLGLMPWSWQAGARVGLLRDRLNCLDFGQWSLITLICDLSHCAYWQRSREAIVIFASDCESHIANIDPLLASVVPVQFSLLHCLSHVIVHKLDQLIGHIFLVVFDALFLHELLNDLDQLRFFIVLVRARVILPAMVLVIGA